MTENQQLPKDPVPQDEDVQFERDKETPAGASTDEEKEITSRHPVGESLLPTKEDTLGNSDFRPLTELEKQPKLPDDEDRISDMNRKSGMDD